MAGSHRSRTGTTATAGRRHGVRAAVSRLAAVVILALVLMGATGGVAWGMIGGKTVPITAAPWTVVVLEYRQLRCTGVIIDPLHILTAGHCVMSGDSATLVPASGFQIEAGVSSFKHPLRSDHPQWRTVRAVRVIPGYVATSKLKGDNEADAVGHDLAVLTLSRPLDLHGEDVRAAYLPTSKTPKPWAVPLVMAGFGNERPKPGVAYANGTLNELVKPTVVKGCSVGQVCVMTTSDTCWGDSGSGLVEPGPGPVEPGPHPVVIGILSEDDQICAPGWDYFNWLTARASLNFIHASMRAPILEGTADRSADAHAVIRPLPAIGIVCVILGVLGVWRIRHSKERRGR